MRITIVIPPLTDFYFTPHRFANHGANILKEKLTALGHEVQWLNFPLAGKKNKAPLPASLNYLKPYLAATETGRLSFFNQYWRFGPSLENCMAEITAFKPELIFLACFAFCYAGELVALAKRLKEQTPHVVLAAGGAGVTVFPEYFLTQAPIDFIITRELETSLAFFMEVLASVNKPRLFGRVPNLYWRDGDVIHASDQNRYTEDDEIHFTLSQAFETGRAIYLTTSLTRGCPRQCLFCINAVCHGKQFRMVPLTKVAAGLDMFYKKIIPCLSPGKKLYINFEDDNILLAPDYFLTVLQLFRQYFPTADFLVENGIDYMLLTPDIISQLMTIGLTHFNLSLASADLGILKKEQRFSKPDHFKKVLVEIKQRGGSVISYFICGFKEDTRETLLKTLLFLAPLPTCVGISPYYALPGLPGFEREIFWQLPPQLCAGSSVYPWHKSLTTETMITAFRLSRLINLLKSPDRTAEEEELIRICFAQRGLFTIIKSRGQREIRPVEPVDAELVALFFKNCIQNINESI